MLLPSSLGFVAAHNARARKGVGHLAMLCTIFWYLQRSFAPTSGVLLNFKSRTMRKFGMQRQFRAARQAGSTLARSQFLVMSKRISNLSHFATTMPRSVLPTLRERCCSTTLRKSRKAPALSGRPL